MAKRPKATMATVVQRRLDRAALLRGTALQAVFGLAFLAPAAAQPAPSARPQGGQVVAGSAAIGTTANATTITQSSNRAAIDWTSFNVGSSQSVTFQQPGATAVTLNRVTGGDPSAIAGRISANGQVILTNPNGVTFYQGAQVNAQSLIVSTAGISNQNFMAGRMAFDRPGSPNARIENHGTITVKQAGLAALVAPSVQNSGVINARMGQVILAGAATHTLDMYGDGLVSIDVTRQVRQAPVGADGKVVTALVTNTGTIAADGGVVQLTAQAADGVVQTLVRAGGTIRANSVGAQAGRIEVAGTGGSVVIEGRVAADGRAPGTVGGTVVLAGSDATVLASTARVSARGAAGGGTVAVGTTLARATAGAGPAPAGTSARTTVAAGARITADATGNGRGGQVTILSTKTTIVDGAVTARGGKAGGDGGTIELSGEEGFRLTGTADAGAPKGQLGTILIDPRDLFITNTAGGNTNIPPTNGADPNIGAGTGGTTTDAYVTPAQIQALTGNVRLQATRDLTVANGIIYGGGSTLTLEAGRNLTVGAVPITLTAAGTTTLQLTAATSTIPGNSPAGQMTILGNLTATNVGLSAGTGGMVIQGSVQAANLLTLRTDTLTLGGNAQLGANTLSLQTFTAGRDILVTTGTKPTTALTLSTADIGRINTQTLSLGGNGTSNVTFGQAGDGTINLTSGLALPTTGTVTVATNLNNTQGSMEVAGGGNVVVNAGATVSGNGNVVVSAGLTTLPNHNPAASLTINGTVSAPEGVYLGAGTGGIALAGSVLGANLVSISTGGALTQTAGLIRTDALYGEAGSVSLPSTTNVFNRIAFRATGAAGDMLIADAVPMTVTTAGGISGLSVAANRRIALRTDGLTVADNGPIAAPNGTISLQPLTDGRTILVTTGAKPSGSLAITTAEATRMSAAVLSLGGNGSSNILFGQEGDGRIDLVRNGGFSQLQVLTTGTVVQNAPLSTSVFTGTAGEVLLQNGVNEVPVVTSFRVVSDFRLNTVSDTILTGTMTAGGIVDIRSASNLTLDPFLTLQAGNAVTLAAREGGTGNPNGVLTVNGTVQATFQAALSSGPAGIVFAGGTFSAPQLDLSTTGPVTQTAGSITTSSLQGDVGSLSLTSRTNAISGIAANSYTPLTITGAAGDLTLVTSSALQIGNFSVSGALQLPSGRTATVVTDSLTIASSEGGQMISAPGGTFVLAPFTPGTGIVLTDGGKPETGLSLTTNEISQIGAPTLQLGILAGTTPTLGAVTIQGEGNIDLGAAGITTLRVLSRGAVTQQAGLGVTTLTGQAASLDLTNGGNFISNLAGFTTGTGGLALHTSSGLTVSGTVSAASGAATVNLSSEDLVSPGVAMLLTGNVTGNLVNLNSLSGSSSVSGGVFQTGGIVTAATLTGAGDTLNLPNANQISALGDFATTRALTLTTARALAVTGAVSSTFGPVTLNAAGLTQTAASSITTPVLGGTSSAAAVLDSRNNRVSGLGTFTVGAGDLTLVTGSPNLTFGINAGAVRAPSGSLRFVADRVGPASSVGGGTIAAADTVSFVPYTAGRRIELIGDTAADAGSLSLSRAFRSGLSAGTLALGDASTTGAINIANAGESVDLTGRAGILRLRTTGAVTEGISPGGQDGGNGGRPGLTVGTVTGTVGTLALNTSFNVIGTLGDLSGTTLSVATTSALQVAGLVAGTDVTLVAGGALTETGVIQATNLTARGASVALTNPLNSFATLTGSSSTGLFEAVDSRALTANALQGPSLKLTVGGDLVLAGAVNVTGTAELDAAGAITESQGTLAAGTLTGRAVSAALTGSNAVGTLGTFTTSGAFALTNGTGLVVTGPVSAPTVALNVTGNLALNGAIAAPTRLTLTASGTITQTGPISTALLDGSAASADLSGSNAVGTLGGFVTGGAFNLVNGQPLTVAGPVNGGSISLASTGDLLLAGTVASGGTVNLVSTGAVTQQSGSVVATTLTGNAGSVTLGSTAIDVLGAFTTSGNFTLAECCELRVNGPFSAANATIQVAGGPSVSGGLVLAGPVTVPGTLNLLVAGAITQTGGSLTVGTLAGNAAEAGFTAAGNSIAALGPFTSAAGLAISDTRDLALTGTVSVRDTFVLNTAGAVSQTGGTLAAGTLTGSAASASFVQRGNAVATLGAFSTTGDFALVDATALSIAGPVSVGAGRTLSLVTDSPSFTGGSLAAPGGTVALAEYTPGRGIVLGQGGGFSQTSLVTADRLVIGSASSGPIALEGALNLSGISVLDLESGGAITQAAAGAIRVPTLTGRAASATLNAANQVGTLGAFATTGAFALTNVAGLRVAGPLAAGDATLGVSGDLVFAGAVSVPGTLRVSISGAVSQEAGTVAAGVLTGSSGGLSLQQRGNAVAGLGAFTSSGGFTLASAVPLRITGQVTTLGTLAVSNDAPSFAAGGLLAAPGRDVVLTEYTPGGGLVLGSASAAGLSAVRAERLTLGSATGGPVTIAGAFDLTGAATVNLLSAGAITESGGGSIQALRLTGSGARISLPGANRIGVVGGLAAGGDLVLTNATALTVEGPVSGRNVTLTSGADMTLGGSIAAPAGTVTLLARQGTITQTGGAITANALTGDAVAASLTRPGNQVATLAGFTTTGDFSFTDGRSLVVTAPVDPNVVTLTVTGDLTLASSVTGGTVVLNATGAIVQTQGQVVAGTLTGQANSIALGGANRIDALGNVTTRAGFLLNDATALAVTGTVSDGTAVGLSSAGAITLAGTVTAPALLLQAASVQQTGGTLAIGTLTGTAGSIDLGRGGVAQIGALRDVVSPGSIIVVDQVPLTLSGTIASPFMQITGTGTLTLDNTVIRTDGAPLAAQVGPGPAPGGSTFAVLNGADGAATIQQLGTATLTTYSGVQPTLRLQLPGDRNGRLLLNNLAAPDADLVLAMGAGTASGRLAATNLTYLNAGGQAQLTGSLQNRADGTAASLARVLPRVDDRLTLNGCVLQATTCTAATTALVLDQSITGALVINQAFAALAAAVASILRPDILTLDVLDLTVTRDRDDPTLLLPNISERDY